MYEVTWESDDKKPYSCRFREKEIAEDLAKQTGGTCREVGEEQGKESEDE